MDAPAKLLARFGPFALDEANATLSRGGQPLALQPKELAVLCELVRRPGQLVSKDELLDTVWGHAHISESVLKTIVSHLRAALGDDAREPRHIATVSRRGYRFIAELAGPEEPLAPAPEPVPLIGRQFAWSQLKRALQAAQGGRRQMLFVAGEPGIGKSTLIDGFVQAQASGAAVARGQCVEHIGSGEPYMPVLEAIDMLCRTDAALPALMRRVAPTWLAQLPWHLDDADRRHLLDEVAGATPERMLREAGELLDRCSATRPLLLVLEDLHWSDHATVACLGYLARRRSAAQLLVLCSFRPAELIAQQHPLASLRQELRLHRLCEEIDLEALSEAELAGLLAARLPGAAVPEPFVQALHAHTGGLPLFVVNVIDELLAEQRLRRDGAAWVFPAADALTVPEHILDVLDMQAARLPDDELQALGAASVAGVEFLHLPLADALQWPAERLQRLLDSTTAQRQWLRSAGVATLPDGRVAGRYAFRHALYRQVFYRRLAAGQRSGWHQSLALALQVAYGPSAAEIAAELALHFERCGQPVAAAQQRVWVARRALARSAPREALQATAQGLAELAGAVPALELDLRVLEAVALSRLNVVVEPVVEAAFERARALCPRAPASPSRPRALHGLWWVHFARGDLARAQALAQEMLDLDAAAPDPGMRLAGCSTLGLTLAMRGQLADARAHLLEALALFERVRDALPPGMFVQDPGVEVGGYLAVVRWWLGEPAAARQHMAAALARAFEVGNPLSQLVALHLQAALHFFAGEVPDALLATERLYGVIRDHDLPTRPGSFAWLHGHAVAALVDTQAGLAEMREALSSCLAMGLRVGLSGYYLHYAQACGDAGEMDVALQAAAEGLQLAVGGHEHYLLSPLHRVQAELLCASGQAQAAAASLQQALDIATQQGARFHQLSALVAAGQLSLLPAALLRERLQALLPDYESESITVVTHARELLAA